MSTTDLGFIHRFIPATAPGKPPLLLLHGTGGDENDLLPLAARIAPGAAHAVAARQGARARHAALLPPERRRRSGTSTISSARTAELADFLQRARAAYGIGEADRARLFQRRQHRLVAAARASRRRSAGAILMRAMLPFDPRPLPDLDRHSGPDARRPARRADPAAAGRACSPRCSARPAPTSTYEVLEAGHGLTEEDLTLAAEWLATRLDRPRLWQSKRHERQATSRRAISCDAGPAAAVRRLHGHEDHACLAGARHRRNAGHRTTSPTATACCTAAR